MKLTACLLASFVRVAFVAAGCSWDACSAPCNCDYNDVNCVNSGDSCDELSVSGIPEITNGIYLSNNSITSLNVGDFDGLLSLEYLFIVSVAERNHVAWKKG